MARPWVGPHGPCRRAVGEPVELTFFDAIFTAHTRDVFIEPTAVAIGTLSEVTIERGLAPPIVHSALNCGGRVFASIKISTLDKRKIAFRLRA